MNCSCLVKDPGLLALEASQLSRDDSVSNSMDIRHAGYHDGAGAVGLEIFQLEQSHMPANSNDSLGDRAVLCQPRGKPSPRNFGMLISVGTSPTIRGISPGHMVNVV